LEIIEVKAVPRDPAAEFRLIVSEVKGLE